MKHEEAVLQLTDFLQGDLSGRIQEEMSEHLATCVECQELAETCLGLAMLPREEGAPAGHPTPDEIALYALRSSTLSGPARAGMVLHLRDCVFCREEVEAARTADGEIAQLERSPAGEPAIGPDVRPAVGPEAAKSMGSEVEPGAGPARRRAGWRDKWMIMVAASLLLVLAGYSIARRVASRELRESRAAIAQMTSDLRDARAWSGPVTLTVLTGEDRSDGPEETIRVAPGQPYVPLAVLPPRPGAAHREERYRFEIVSAAGETVWSLDMAGNAAWDQAAVSGVVNFLVPAPSLPPGRYTFRVVGLDADPGHLLLKAPFTVSESG